MEGEIDLRRYVRVFLRRKWIFISIFLGIIVFTAIKTTLTPKTFRTSSKILVKETSTLLGKSQILEEAFGIETNCEILRSRGFAEKVISHMREKKVKAWLLHSENAPDILLGSTKVIPLRGSHIIQITVEARDAEEVASITNSITETFKEYSVEIARIKVTEVRKFIEAQLPEVQERLKEAEESLRKFKEKEKLISISASGSALQEELVKLQSEYGSKVSQISITEALIVRLKQELKKENERLAEEIVKIDNPSLSSLRAQLLMFGNEYSSYVIAGLAPEHPKLIGLNKKIEEIKQRLKQKATSRAEEEVLSMNPLFYIEELSGKIFNEKFNLIQLQSAKSAMEKRIKEYQERVRRFPTKEYKLARLERTYEFNESIYQSLIDRYEEAKITEVGEIGNVVIIEQAIPPQLPIYPKPVRNLILALVFGIGIGIGGVIVQEHLDTSIKEVGEIEKLKIPVAGAIPVHSDGIIEDPASPSAEAYKKLQINLKFSKPGSLKTLLVSSCVAEEGKTTLVSNLGVTYARTLQKTVVIEGDLRKPSLHKLFEISSKVGLSNLLVGDAKIEDVIFPTKIENLWIIPAGHIPPNPGELIDSELMKTLISELRKNFEMVIIDSPPLITCADGFLLGNMVEGVILALELRKIPRELLLQTISSFKSTGAVFLGVVINKVKEGMYYKYHYYYKHYTPKS
ncbi:polysaccharide biosynthesis tyrosine autokinase [candidate division WOR-3 bacterium]|nr:polysaccharide biosynthesis tyrosine autokinase [candidate division WOR-3 bacterium]